MLTAAGALEDLAEGLSLGAGGYLPNPNFSGKGPGFPANIPSNPKFQAASRPVPKRAGAGAAE